MKDGISGFICVKNALTFDYCVELVARSLLPVVDELILCDSNSTDGTTDILHSISGARVINFDVENPVVGRLWSPIWRNFAREYCQYKMHIALDADEILENTPECYQAVREADAVTKARVLTFWRDEHTLTPENCCERDMVVRLAPSDQHCQYGDTFPGMETEPCKDDPRIRIFHVGFLRKPEALFAKATLTHVAHCGAVDPRFVMGHAAKKRVHEIDWGWYKPLREYQGGYPPGVLEWIQERKV